MFTSNWHHTSSVCVEHTIRLLSLELENINGHIISSLAALVSEKFEMQIHVSLSCYELFSLVYRHDNMFPLLDPWHIH